MQGIAEYISKLPNHGVEKTMHLGAKLRQEAERLELKPAQVAKLFGIKPPSVYDWYNHGRIHKKHYPKLVEMSGKPLTWWLDFPEETIIREERAVYGATAMRRPPVLAKILEGLSGYLSQMDAGTRRRAGLLLADLTNAPEDHAKVAAAMTAMMDSGNSQQASGGRQDSTSFHAV